VSEESAVSAGLGGKRQKHLFAADDGVRKIREMNKESSSLRAEKSAVLWGGKAIGVGGGRVSRVTKKRHQRTGEGL